MHDRRWPVAGSLRCPASCAYAASNVTPIARPGVHFDLGKAASRCRGSSPCRWPRDAGTGRPCWMRPLLALASSAKVIFFFGSSVEEITPSRTCSFAASTFRRCRRALEQVLAHLVRGVAKRPALQLCGQAAVPARRRRGCLFRVSPDQADVIQSTCTPEFRHLHGHRGAVVGAAVRLGKVHDDLALGVQFQFRVENVCPRRPD